MLAEQLEPGKKWIETELRAALREIGTSFVGPFLWRLDLNTQRCTLEAEISGERRTWTFSYEDVSDCLSTPKTQNEIRRRLRAL